MMIMLPSVARHILFHVSHNQKNKIKMGARIFNTYVKLDSTEPYPIRKIAKEIFNSKDIEMDKYDDSRSTNITVGIHDSGVMFSNIDLNNQIMREHDKKWINKLYQFFNQPKYIVAYMISDFNNAAGYTIIENGEVIRSRYFDPQDEIVNSHDVGKHLEEEKDSINEIMKRDSFDKDKNMSFTKMYYTGKIEYFHYTDVGMVEILIKKYLGFGAYWGPENIQYNLIRIDKEISEFS